jgi:hypothetical protein
LPSNHRPSAARQLVERPAEVGQLVESGGVDTARIEVAQNQAVTFSPSKRVDEHLVRDTVEGFVEVLVPAPPVL